MYAGGPNNAEGALTAFPPHVVIGPVDHRLITTDCSANIIDL